MSRRSDLAGMTVIEVVAVFTVIVLLAGIFLPVPFRSSCRHSPQIKCVNNLKNVGLAFRIFSTDNNERFPAAVMMTNGVPLAKIDALRVYLALTNELSTPKILYCPEDEKRREALSFTNVSLKNISYFVSLSAGETMPQSLLAGDRNLKTNGVTVPSGILAMTKGMQLSWSKEIHNEQGNIAMADGSVQQFSSTRLKQGLGDQAAELGTNYLAIP